MRDSLIIVLSTVLVDYLSISKLREILIALRFGCSGKHKVAVKKKKVLKELSIKEKLTLSPIVLSSNAKETALRIQKLYLIYLSFAIAADIIIISTLIINQLRSLHIWIWSITIGLKIVFLCVVRFIYYKRGLNRNPTI